MVPPRQSAEGTPNPRQEWTFGIVERLFDLLLAQGITTWQRYGLFGHSAVGQFVHRMFRSLSATVWPSLVSASAGILLFAIAEAGYTQRSPRKAVTCFNRTLNIDS